MPRRGRQKSALQVAAYMSNFHKYFPQGKENRSRSSSSEHPSRTLAGLLSDERAKTLHLKKHQHNLQRKLNRSASSFGKIREERVEIKQALREIMAKVVPRLNPDDIKTAPGTCGELGLQLEWHRMRGDKEMPKKTRVGRKDQKIEALIAAIERHNAGTQCNSAETASVMTRITQPSLRTTILIWIFNLVIHLQTIVSTHCNLPTYLQQFSVACGIALKRFLGASHFQSRDTQTQLVASSSHGGSIPLKSFPLMRMLHRLHLK